MSKILLYGAYGYTGKLIAELAKKQGVEPILAGRSEEKLLPMAEAFGFPYRVFSLDDNAALESALRESEVILHCAGPFVRTFEPVAEACIRTGTHYLDITGELAVYEWLAKMDKRAKEAGVMLLPGVGYDIVPSDCLGAHLKSRLPEAESLAISIRTVGGISHGTAMTAAENFSTGGMIRKNGEIVRVPHAYKTRQIDFGDKVLPAVTIQWGDISAAYYSTGIPNIEVFMADPPVSLTTFKIARYLGWLIGSGPVQRFIKKRIDNGPAGPSDKVRKEGFSMVWGEVTDKNGNQAVSRLKCPEAYTLTALAGLLIAKKVVSGDFKPGFQTPSLAYGKDLILEIEGTERWDD